MPQWLAFMALVLASVAAPVAAQKPATKKPAAKQSATAGDTVKLSYKREVFSYPTTGRRDPFLPLTASTGVGPRFEDLSLEGIMYSPVSGHSVALLTAGSRIFTVHAGDVVGNARVVEIDPARVVFAVNDFGSIRQEMLELKRKEGAGG